MANNAAMATARRNPHEDGERILEFWFGRERTATAAEVAAEKSELWWGKNEHTDREIATRFTAATEAVAAGELASWAESPRGLLALIICADQFPRNIYRNSPKAFACDPIALNFAKLCVDGGAARQLRPIERVFAYLPFEHSEVLAEQQRSLALYEELAESVDAAETELFENYCDYARQHHDIIARFGRFPHRNRILGRPSSAEEVAFLEQPGSSF